MGYTIILKKPRYQITLRRGTQGVGVPEGGNPGDVLTKNSATDFDTSWQPPGAAAVEAYLNALPEWNSDEEALKPVIDGGGGMSVGEWYRTGEFHLSAPPGIPKKIYPI